MGEFGLERAARRRKRRYYDALASICFWFSEIGDWFEEKGVQMSYRAGDYHRSDSRRWMMDLEQFESLVEEYIAQVPDDEEHEWYTTDRTFVEWVFKGWHSSFEAFLPWLKRRLSDD